MSRPPLKALEQIRNYCNKTQCRQCIFVVHERLLHDDLDVVGCRLQASTPCDWKMSHDECNELFNKQEGEA